MFVKPSGLSKNLYCPHWRDHPDSPIPIIGNAAEHSTAIVMAVKDNMALSVEIAVSFFVI